MLVRGTEVMGDADGCCLLSVRCVLCHVSAFGVRCVCVVS